MLVKVVLMGPQGCGKGTQAELLVKEFGFKHFSTGDVLRARSKVDDALGREIKEIMLRGELVPPRIINSIVSEAVKSFDDLLFDGFPRNLDQAELLSSLTGVDSVVEIVISDDEAVRRISARRVCESCGKSFNLLTLPPKVDGVCDACGGRLVQRADDQPEAIRKRLSIYHEETEPLKDYYSNRGVPVFEINGEQSIEAVFADIKKVLSPLFDKP